MDWTRHNVTPRTHGWAAHLEQHHVELLPSVHLKMWDLWMNGVLVFRFRCPPGQELERAEREARSFARLFASRSAA